MDVPLVALLVDASERALDRALGGLDAAGFPGLSPSHALAVQLIEAGVATTRDIAVAMRMTPQAVSAIIDHLEARGLAVRRRQEHDARAKAITLTADGRRLAAEITRALAAVEREWADLVGAGGLDALKASLGAWVAAGAAGRPDAGRPRRRRVRIG